MHFMMVALLYTSRVILSIFGAMKNKNYQAMNDFKDIKVAVAGTGGP